MTTTSSDRAKQILNKVPEVTLIFWIIKIMATTVGETGADFLIYNLDFGLPLTSLSMSVLLAVVLVIQVRFSQYVPWIYWLAVVMISIVGTLISDSLVDIYDVSLATTTIIFSFALLVTFVVWYRSEKTLSIQTICTFKREMYYWAAILFTFALGTAAGDLVSEGWGLGYAVSGFIFAGLLAAVVFGYYVFKSNTVLAFWIAYILTRPLGASFGDYLSQSVDHGGLGFGAINTSIVFLMIIFVMVVYLTRNIQRQEVKTDQ